jgi:hypothetical protein
LTLAAAEPIVVAVKTWLVLALGCLAFAGAGSPVVSACGDKFVLVGRAMRFEHAYATIHPASILIVLPLKSVKSAAVRDSRLLTALKMAGHHVEVIQQPVTLAEVVGRSRHDIILAERSDASAIRDIAAPAGQPKPSIVGVLEDPSPVELTAARLQFEYVMKTPDSLAHILNLMDDVMKARLDNARRTAASGS